MKELNKKQEKSDLLKAYQDFVRRVDLIGKEETKLRMLHYISGLSSESGEVAALYQKCIRSGGAPEDIDTIKLRDELGDLLWYFTAVAQFHEISIEEIICQNMIKLKQRYGDRV